MAIGRSRTTSVGSGGRIRERSARTPIGRRIVTVIGRGVRHTVGRGLVTSRGVGRRITTVVGCFTATRGRGCRVVSFIASGVGGARRWWHSSH